VTTGLVFLWLIALVKAGIIIWVVYAFAILMKIRFGIAIYCVLLALYLAGSIFLLVMVGRGRNWARIVLTVQVVIEAWLSLLSGNDAKVRHGAELMGYYAPVTIYVTGAVLLYVARANEWFAAKKAALAG